MAKMSFSILLALSFAAASAQQMRREAPSVKSAAKMVAHSDAAKKAPNTKLWGELTKTVKKPVAGITSAQKSVLKKLAGKTMKKTKAPSIKSAAKTALKPDAGKKAPSVKAAVKTALKSGAGQKQTKARSVKASVKTAPKAKETVHANKKAKAKTSMAVSDKASLVEVAQSASPVATETKKKGDAALAEAESQTIVMYTLGEKSPESKALDEVNRQRIERSRKWKDAANPVDDYEEAAGSVSFSQVSKKRSDKAKAYDGMQAMGSGFWAEDRPDEKRVDISDHKIYTWAQYRAKHLSQHSWTAEVMFKKLPTLKRVKKLGKRAFIQRFR